MTAFVPTHRCGAVPEFHRVPSYDIPPGGQDEPAATTTLRPRLRAGKRSPRGGTVMPLSLTVVGSETVVTCKYVLSKDCVKIRC
jgi:hypothetical protein